jgi:hypothetical protein
MKKIASNFWFQTFFLITIVALVACIRLALPTSEHGQISPLYFILDYADVLIALLTAGFIVVFLLSAEWIKKLPHAWISFFLVILYLIFNLLFNLFHGSGRLIPSFLGELFNESVGLASANDLLGQWTMHVIGRSIHATVHPPGFFLYLIVFNNIFGASLVADWLVTVLLVALSSTIIYSLLKRIADSKVAFIGALLFISAGNLILYGGTIDGFICAYTVLIILMVIKLLENHSYLLALLLGLAMAIGVFLAYQYMLILCFYFFILLFDGILHKKMGTILKNMLLLLSSLLGIVIFYVLLKALTGFDVVYCFSMQQQKSEEVCFAAGWSVLYWLKTQVLGAEPFTGSHREYWLWMPGNFLAYMFIIGPATAVLFWRRFVHAMRNRSPHLISRALVLATGISFLLIGLSGLVLGETERVWLFMLPFFIISAAPIFNEKKNLPDYRLIILVNLASLWVLDFLARAIV